MRHFYVDILRRRRESKSEPNDMLQALQGQTYKDGRTLSDREIAHISTHCLGRTSLTPD